MSEHFSASPWGPPPGSGSGDASGDSAGGGAQAAPADPSISPTAATGAPAASGAPVPPSAPPPVPMPPGYGPGHGQPHQPGQYQPAQYGQPNYSYAQALAQSPQPGIIPLRPLRISEILEGALGAIRHNPKVMFGQSLVVHMVTSLVIVWFITQHLTRLRVFVDNYQSGRSGSAITASEELFNSVLASGFFVSVVYILGQLILTGVLTLSVSQSVIGVRISIKEAWRRGARKLLPLMGLAILLTLCVVAAFAISMLTASENMSPAKALVIVILGLSPIFMIIAAVRLSLATMCLVLEDLGPWGALYRSWKLTRRSFWKLVGIFIVLGIITGVLSGITSVPSTFIGGLVIGSVQISNLGIVVMYLSVLATLLLTGLVTSSALAVTYIELRIRREGLDIQLSQAAQTAHQSAHASLQKPPGF